MIREGSVPANPEQPAVVNETQSDLKLEQEKIFANFKNSKSPIIKSEMIDKISSSLRIDSNLDMIEKGSNCKEIKTEPNELTNTKIDISSHPTSIVDDVQLSENVHEGLNNTSKFIKAVKDEPNIPMEESNTPMESSNYESPKQQQNFKNTPPEYLKVWGNPWGWVNPDGTPRAKNSIICEFCKKVFNPRDNKRYCSDHFKKCQKYHQFAIGGKMCKFCGKNDFSLYGKLLGHIETTHFMKNNHGTLENTEKIITNNSDEYNETNR